MADITLDHMTFTGGGQTYNIPLKPPMVSYREARERVVAMDRDCVEALGISDVTIKEYIPPTGLYAIEFLIIVATFLGYSQRWWFGKGQIVEAYLGSAFAQFSWNVQRYLFSGMLAIHAGEMAWFIRSRLRRHSVSPRSLIWWQWAGSTFIEGVFAIGRFNSLVVRKQEAKEKQKH